MEILIFLKKKVEKKTKKKKNIINRNYQQAEYQTLSMKMM